MRVEGNGRKSAREPSIAVPGHSLASREQKQVYPGSDFLLLLHLHQ
jgi:hypothetical protein